MAFQSIISRPYFVVYSHNASLTQYYVDPQRDIAVSSGFGHHFCGTNDIPGAWCPNCDKPLLSLLTLDTKDSRLGLEGDGRSRIPLLYCWTCNIDDHGTYEDLRSNPGNYERWYSTAGDGKLFCLSGDSQESSELNQYTAPFYYELIDNNVMLLQYTRGGVHTDDPYEQYPIYFPGSRASLIEITDHAQRIIEIINAGEDEDLPIDHVDLNQPQHQVGGEPSLSQRDTHYIMNCPKCKAIMPFLASLGNNCMDPRGISGDDFFQILFHYCQSCHIVGAVNQVD